MKQKRIKSETRFNFLTDHVSIEKQKKYEALMRLFPD